MCVCVCAFVRAYIRVCACSVCVRVLCVGVCVRALVCMRLCVYVGGGGGGYVWCVFVSARVREGKRETDRVSSETARDHNSLAVNTAGDWRLIKDNSCETACDCGH